MNIDSLVRHFGRIGATLEVDTPRIVNRWQVPPDYSLDVKTEGKKEFYLLELANGKSNSLDFQVLNTRQDLRHLVLMVRNEGIQIPQKEKFLCGHDERHWFVAGLREGAVVTDVFSAMESLKPAGVVMAQSQLKVSTKDRNKRHNPGFVRQGEWFFVPKPDFQPGKLDFILKNEILSRGFGSKPHTVSELIRSSGEAVYWNRRNGKTMSVKQYTKLLKQGNLKNKNDWSLQRQVSSVMVRGKVRHADHATIVLPFWHQVTMANERASVSNRFID